MVKAFHSRGLVTEDSPAEQSPDCVIKYTQERKMIGKVRFMMKKICLLLVPMVLINSSVCMAKITPPEGYGQIGLPSVVLCNSLTLYSEPGQNAIQTLSYGDRPIVMRQEGGWANVALGDALDSQTGWVNEVFLGIDPAWYETVEDTSVYAWNDTAAPKVALLDTGVSLPILKDDGDWLVVSLRGASGWIHNPDRSSGGPAAQGSDGTDVNPSDNRSSITAYDEYGTACTLYEDPDGYWREDDGTTYIRLSDTQFQVKEGTKRLTTEQD